MSEDATRRPAPSGGAADLAPASRIAQREFEIEFFEVLLLRNPNLVDAVRAHARNLALSGQLSRALYWDLRHARLRPDDPIPHYNVACSRARMGDIDEAFVALEQAIDLGYPLMRWILRDPDLKPLRRDPRYSELVRKLVLGRIR